MRKRIFHRDGSNMAGLSSGVSVACGLLLSGVLHAQTLDIRPVVAVRGPAVLLGDIVQDSSALPEGWGERSVTKAPPVGKLQQLALTDLAYELQQYPDMEKVTLRGNTELRLQRQSRALTQEELSRAVRGYVESDERWRGERAEIALQKNMHEVQVPLGKSEIQAVGDEEGEGDGDYLIKAHVVVDGSVATEIRIPAKILIMKEVWTAARPIARGRILTAEDLVVRLRPIQSDHGKLIVSTDDVRGMEVDRQIKIDQPILRHCLREPVCAQRGDTVQVMGRRNNLEVAVQAKALSGGRRGDRIMCVNESSKRQFLACLVGPREATLAQ